MVLNLINQDAQKQHPIIIVDAKGDDSFLNYLNQDSKTAERLLVFDMSSDSPTCSYDPLLAGTATQAAQRLFNSLCWSEEYYKLRSRELLFTLFENFERNRGKRITLLDLRRILKSVDLINKECGFIEEFTRKDHADIAGLQAQARLKAWC